MCHPALRARAGGDSRLLPARSVRATLAQVGSGGVSARRLSRPGTRLLLLAGSAHDQRRGGPPKIKEEEIRGDFFFSAEFRARYPEKIKEHVDLYFHYPTPLVNYLQHVVARQTHQTLDLLPNITAPTLVIVGEKDTATLATGNHVATSRVLAERIPNAELTILENAAHSFFQESPERANEVVLAFLRRH